MRNLHTVNGPRLIMAPCAHCGQPGALWEGQDGRLYCGEFCEEGGPTGTEEARRRHEQ